MFIIHCSDNKGITLCGDADSIIHLAYLFEQNKIEFTVSDKFGTMDQDQFGFSDFKFWMIKKNY
jgi:hypothetical protein